MPTDFRDTRVSRLFAAFVAEEVIGTWGAGVLFQERGLAFFSAKSILLIFWLETCGKPGFITHLRPLLSVCRCFLEFLTFCCDCLLLATMNGRFECVGFYSPLVPALVNLCLVFGI